jgi:hypothetical protein
VLLFKNRCFGGTERLLHQDNISKLGIALAIELPVIANVIHSSLILSNMMEEVICSSETSVVTRDIRRHIPENGILHTAVKTSNLA